LDLPGAIVHEYRGRPEEIMNAVKSAKPDVVYHFASLFLTEHKFDQIGDLVDANLKFPTQLLDAMAANGCPNFVTAGTAWQTYENKTGTAANLYAATKEAFEAILRYFADAKGLRAIILKLSDTYGPGDTRRKLLAILRESSRKGEVLDLSPGEQKIDLLHVNDVVEAFKTAGQRVLTIPSASIEDFSLKSGKTLSVRELVDLFNRVAGKPVKPNWGGREYRNREVMAPPAGGKTLPGWNPKIDLETGLRSFANES
jgi:nucleoside-diphosphate-sugar epimerase